MTASGRRIKRRGSGRSSCDEMDAAAAVVSGGDGGATPGAGGEHSAHSGNNAVVEAEAIRVHKLLDAQKRAYEVGRPASCFF